MTKSIELKAFSFINKAGGTGLSNWKYDPHFEGVAKVTVTKHWYDYETGNRFIGEAASADLKKYLKANASPRDQRVFFDEFDLAESNLFVPEVNP